jgi:hypothetical protein
MSWQAMEAVQDHSKLDDHTALCIMYAIARHADENGIVGAGGRLTSPNADRLADKAKVSRRTFFNWLPKLEESGELTVERNGAGRGAWNKYTINLPINSANDEINGASSPINGATHVAPLDQNNGANNGAITVQDLALMVQNLTVMVQEMVQNGATHVAPNTIDTKDTYIYTEPDSNEIAQIKTAISEVTKTPWQFHEEDYDKAAYALFGWEATPKKIKGFTEWWTKYGHYPGKPALKSLVNEYRNYVNGNMNGVSGQTQNGLNGSLGGLRGI